MIEDTIAKNRELINEILLIQLQTADLEYRLCFAMCVSTGDATCARYLAENRERLLPKMVQNARESGEDAAVVVHRFVKGVHLRHEEGLPLS